MGRSPCCDKIGLKKGPWTPEEDQKLLAYIEEHGHGSWRALPSKAGLQRCGKSCRLRWTNYLRPDIKRGKFTSHEEQTIIQLHALLGNRWSAIATHLPKRTDNEIKNYWNTHLKKRLTKMGIDPVTHKSKNDALISSSNDGAQSKNSANLSHMAQWESARLEAEARLVRESRLRSVPFQHPLSGNSSPVFPPTPPLRRVFPVAGIGDDLESPTSTLTFFENNNATTLISTNNGLVMNNNINSSDDQENEMVKEEGEDDQDQWNVIMSNTIHDMTLPCMDTNTWSADHEQFINGGECFTELLLCSSNNRSDGGDSNNTDDGEEKNYWNTILNLVNSSPPDSPMF